MKKKGDKKSSTKSSRKRRLLLTMIGMGFGWILGVTTMLIAMPVTGKSAFQMTFTEAIANTLIFGFPGILMFLLAIYLSFKDEAGQTLFGGKF